MLQHIRPAVTMVVLFTIITGVAYPFALTGIAAVVAPHLASGSMISRGGKVVGSALIGQDFTSDRYFHGRPSATVATDPKDPAKTIAAPYNAANSSGSNLGPTSQALLERVKSDVGTLRQHGIAGAIPADAVTASGSGLDPDISPTYALLQVPRVAKARDLPEARLQALVAKYSQGATLGFVGEPRVNVLLLNLALDGLPTS